MNKEQLFTTSRQHQKKQTFFDCCRFLLLFVTGMLLLTISSSRIVFAASSSVTIEVLDRSTSLPVPDGFKYLINEDIAHDDASTTNPLSYSPIVSLGDDATATTTLPPGDYLVSVMGGPFPAVPEDPGYKLGGQHFTVDGSGSAMTIVVELVPNPLPLASIKVVVFHDNFSVNGEEDIPVEGRLAGFNVVISDPIGEVGVDFFGNPLCTEYDSNDDPIPNTGGTCLTDANGEVTIENLPPLKYEVEAIPPDNSGWIQTSTLEGTHHMPAWIEEGSNGLASERDLRPSPVWFGFVKDCTFGDSGDNCPTNNTIPADAGSITGRIRQLSLDTDAPGVAALGSLVAEPYLALNNLSGNDEQVWTGVGAADGSFTIPDVPPGQYQLVIFDFFQDYIMQFHTVNVGANEAVDIGDIGIPRWFGTIGGYVYLDTGIAQNGTTIPGSAIPAAAHGPDSGTPGAKNGYRDCLGGADPHVDLSMCEPGLPNEGLDVRFKDGTIVYTAVSDANGYYDYPEYFEWEHFLIWEVGYARHEQVGTAGYFTEPDGLDAGKPLGYPYDPVNFAEFGPAALLQGQVTWAGTTNWIDTGKHPWGAGENGGIAGIVYYATTRNEFDPRLAGAEDYEPGIPGVTLNLYEAALDVNDDPIACTAVGPGCPYGAGELMRASDTPIDSVATDGWEHPTDCEYETPVPGSGVFDTDPDCLEVPRTWNQIKDGVFDGGYAFEGTPAGDYIVEVVSPPGYRHIAEEDQNTDQGDDFIIPAVPPPPCAGPLHLVDDPRNPAHGTMQPRCDSKLVYTYDNFNAEAEFFLMTLNEVPPAGMIRGLLVDDLTVDFNPDSPLYVEKRGIPNTPIGILDFLGNEITTVYSDDYGYWEVLLPSTYTAHCPTPGGVCPGMYRIVGNYPGDPFDPDPQFNPNYSTLSLVFDVWPGKTTFADVAILPITMLVQDPGGLFDTPPICDIASNTPDLQSVQEVIRTPGSQLKITGRNFGSVKGSVQIGSTTYSGSSITVWTNTQIRVNLSTSHPVGPHQVTVIHTNGNISPTGLTIHVTGSGYNPAVLYVDAAAPDGGSGSSGSPFNVIQDAIDAASDGHLIIVRRGQYFESPIVYRNVKIQGHGYRDTIIDGRFFDFPAVGGISSDDFDAKIAAINPVGPSPVPSTQVFTIVAQSTSQHDNASYTTQIDGFTISNGGVTLERKGIESIQGGGIYAHAFAHRLELSNNLVQSSSGHAGGGIVFGQAYITNPDAGNVRDNQNDNVRIHHNRVLNNGGSRYAGGIGLFNGTADYEIDHNIVCGNYSAEYGGGISHFGFSPGGHLHDNKILYNGAFDEGGGLMIGGELPNNPNAVSAGAGDVLIERNLFQGNFTNDDGGAIRMLQPVDGPITLYNNFIVNNLATDHGGGIAIDDALDVLIINNTIIRNISTATAEDADRSSCSPPALGSCPHGAGITSETHSAALRAAEGLPAGSFSDPVLLNNIIWENEAFYLDGTGALPSAGFIDMEVVDVASPPTMTPNYSLLTTPYGTGVGNIDSGSPPGVASAIDLDFIAIPFAGDPAFVTILIKSGPGDPQGDYHLAAGSAAIDAGVTSFGGDSAPTDDIDRETRDTSPDMGADERPGAGPTPTPTPTSPPGPTPTPTATPIPPGPTPTPTATPIPPPTPTPGVGCTLSCLRVDDIVMTGRAQGPNGRARADVFIVNESSSAVAGATVFVTWDLPGGGTVITSATTNGAGRARFQVNSSLGTYTITVTNVTFSSSTFDPANSVLTDSITVP
jgi:large repetitive protein